MFSEPRYFCRVGAMDMMNLQWLERTRPLNQFVGPHAQRGRHFEAELRGGPKIDDEFEFGVLLNRKVRRLLALEDATRKHSGPPIGVDGIDPIGQEPAARDVITIGIDRRELSTSGERNDLFATAAGDGAGQ